MNTCLALLLTVAFMFTASGVYAEVRVTDKLLQKGVFTSPECAGASDCLCEADIHYPVFSGLLNPETQDQLNDGSRKSAEQLKCQGKPAEAAGGNDHFSVKHTYEVTFQSQKLTGLKFVDWAYEGGAHGNSMVDGLILDNNSGKILSLAEILGSHSAEVNHVIYETLAPKSDGIFRDEIENRKDSFIKDGKCKGCTIILSKEGVQVVFQAYEVAPFVDGNPAVTIPAQYIAYPAIAQAFK